MSTLAVATVKSLSGNPTHSGTGRYIVNMSITLGNSNYVPLVGGIFDTNDGDGTTICSNRRISLTTTTFGIRGNGQGSAINDLAVVWAAVFGG